MNPREELCQTSHRNQAQQNTARPGAILQSRQIHGQRGKGKRSTISPLRLRSKHKLFQVNYSTNIDRAIEVATHAIQQTDRVLPDTAEIVVRSLWDDTGGHNLSGILLEGRYKIEDVRNRTKIRSEVLKNITKHLYAAKIPLASPRLRIEEI